jgi:hypothetical protein
VFSRLDRMKSILAASVNLKLFPSQVSSTEFSAKSKAADGSRTVRSVLCTVTPVEVPVRVVKNVEKYCFHRLLFV